MAAYFELTLFARFGVGGWQVPNFTGGRSRQGNICQFDLRVLFHHMPKRARPKRENKHVLFVCGGENIIIPMPPRQCLDDDLFQFFANLSYGTRGHEGGERGT